MDDVAHRDWYRSDVDWVANVGSLWLHRSQVQCSRQLINIWLYLEFEWFKNLFDISTGGNTRVELTFCFASAQEVGTVINAV